MPTCWQVRSYEDVATRTKATITRIDPSAMATRISAYSTALAPRSSDEPAILRTPTIITGQTVGWGPSCRISPSRSADMMAWARLAAPSFSYSLEMWVFAVDSLM